MKAARFLRLADVDVHGKRVFIRSDLNVPQDDSGQITDDTRIRASIPAIEDALARGVIHYVALGDKHSLTDVGSTGRVWYSGSPEVTNYDDVEADPGHVLIVDLDEADQQRRVTVDSPRVGRWRFSTLNRDRSGGFRRRHSRQGRRPMSVCKQFRDRHRKAVALFRYRLNVLLPGRGFAKLFAQGRYVDGEIGFFNEAVGPDPTHQFFFGG